MDEFVRSRLGGFLLPTANAVRSTGHHPAREDIDRADHIGVVLEPTVHARELGLFMAQLYPSSYFTSSCSGFSRAVSWAHTSSLQDELMAGDGPMAASHASKSRCPV